MKKILFMIFFIISCSPIKNSENETKSNDGGAIKAELDRLVNPLIAEKKKMGVVVGIINDRKENIYYYGKDAKDGKPIRRETIFEIGSLTKILTSYILEDAVQQKIVKLDDPIELHLPSHVKVADFNGKKITLKHLATHMSSLPRIASNHNISGLNPYQNYSKDDLYKFLSGYKLERAPGEKYEYSNLGAGVLGHIFELKYKKAYEDIVFERFCSLLNIPDTRITLSVSQTERFAKGYYYDKEDGLTKVPAWDFDVLKGAGAYRSTITDMLKFLDQNINVYNTDLNRTIHRMHEIQYKDVEEDISMALGWHIVYTDDFEIIWHNGGTYGFSSFIGFVKEKKMGVVLLSNTFSLAMELDTIGVKILKSML